MSRNPEYVREPEQFIPERWMRKSIQVGIIKVFVKKKLFLPKIFLERQISINFSEK